MIHNVRADGQARLPRGQRSQMRALSVLMACVVASLAFAAASLNGPGVAFASFHCIRIHAVLAGFEGDNRIEYVELRMDAPGQGLVHSGIPNAPHTIRFFDASGVLKATFTFPADVTNAATGDSILIATHEFNASALGGAADFEFSMANTVGANGGDPLHPVQGTSGKAEYAPESTSSCVFPPKFPLDSLAYGSATADAGFGSAAVALPSSPDHRALRLSNLSSTPTDNSTEYSLQPVAPSTFSVTLANLPTDFTTPRNNARTVLELTSPPSVGGLAEPPSLTQSTTLRSAPSDDQSERWIVGIGSAVALAGAGAAGWYVQRRRLQG
jgi:hypothetical protein